MPLSLLRRILPRDVRRDDIELGLRLGQWHARRELAMTRHVCELR